jgi:hypothetical protein
VDPIGSEYVSLAALAKVILKKFCLCCEGVTVQTGEHSSVQDAQAAVRLYTMFRLVRMFKY